MKKLTFEKYQDADGQWRWRLVSENGRIVADSGQGYTRKKDCELAITLIRQNTMAAEVVELK